MEKLNKARDSGLAMVLISLLLLYWFNGKNNLLWIPIAGLVLVMAVPKIFSFLSPLWFGFSQLLGNIVSKVIFSFLFFVVVTPIGFIMRMANHDSLGLKKWSKKTESAFIVREHTFGAADLKNPF